MLGVHGFHCLCNAQAPKPQQSKEAKALAAANSSKGKKKVVLLKGVQNEFCPVALSRLVKLLVLSALRMHMLFDHQLSTFPLSPQKWSKGKMKEKVNNMVLFDKVRLFC